MMLSKTITYDGAVVTIRRADVRARLRASIVYQKFDISRDMPADEWVFLRTYARFLAQATVEGDLGFAMPTVTDDIETLRAGLDNFLSLEGIFYDLITLAFNEVDRVIGDPDFVPESELDAPKKTTTPSGSEETSS